MVAPDGTYGGGLYGGDLYGGEAPRYPTLHVRMALDRDGYDLGGIATGDNSTCESLGDWTAAAGCALSLNTAAAWCYTGSHSIKVTGNGTSDAAEVSIFGLGDSDVITPGRTYLLFVHVRPEAMVRQVRLELLWKSATDVFLTADIAVREAVATGWTRIGVMATAPPAAGRLDIGVDWLGCELGEVHYLDAVTVEDVGIDITDDILSGECTLSGRSASRTEPEAGTSTLLLQNPDGRYTPERAATTLAPYAGNIEPRRRVWELAEYLGVLHPVWSGYTQRWKPTYPGSMPQASQVTVTCVDAFRWLTSDDVPAPYRAEVLASGPLSYFPLDEPSASASAGDLVAGAPAALRTASGGSGDTAFGATSVLPVLLSGSTTDAGSTSLGFNLADDLASKGGVLDLRFAGGVPPVAAIGWTFEAWIFTPETAPSVAPQIVFRHVVPSGGVDYLSGFQLTLETTGQLRLVTGPGDIVGTSAPSICNGNAYHVAITYGPGGDFGTAALYLNGGLVHELELPQSPFLVDFPQIAQFGGAMSDITSTPSFLFTGRGQHVAFYYRRLPGAELAAHYHAGADGHYLETEAERLHAILDFAGWPIEDTRIDAGLTQLLPRDWSAANPLALGQDTVAHAGSVLVVDALGRLRYPNRHRWVNLVPVVADFRASTNTEVEVADFAPWLDDEDVENIIEVNRTGGANIVIRDEASVRRYGPNKGAPLTLGAATDDESLTQAQWRLSRTATPHTRVDTATSLPHTAGPALWPQVLPLEFGHRITMGETPDTAPAPEIDALVGQITHRFVDETWTTTLRLEAAVIDTIWVLDDPVYGYLDTPECVLGY